MSVGFLYVRQRLIQTLRPSHVGHPAGTWTDRETVEFCSTIDRLHLGDYPHTLLVGFAAAVRYALATGLTDIQERNRYLGALCRERLAAVSGVEQCDAEQGTTGTVPFNVRGMHADAAVEALGRRGVTVCTLYAHHVLLGLRKLRQEALVRVSAHYWNTEEEIDRLVGELRRLTS